MTTEEPKAYIVHDAPAEGVLKSFGKCSGYNISLFYNNETSTLTTSLQGEADIKRLDRLTSVYKKLFGCAPTLYVKKSVFVGHYDVYVWFETADEMALWQLAYD